LIEESVKHGEFEINPNYQFEKKLGKYYGFSWITGPMFAGSIEKLLNKMCDKAKSRNYKPYKKIFIIDRMRSEDGKFK